VNLSLLQRPKKVRSDTKALYIYAPSVLDNDRKLKPEAIIKILEVNEGPTPEETVLKVIENDVWVQHQRRWYGREKDLCTFIKAKHGEYDDCGERPQCECEKPLAEMPDLLREATHYVLLSDIGK
jgi:hypothetical protein